MGMMAWWSHSSATRRRMPEPSEPRTRQVGTVEIEGVDGHRVGGRGDRDQPQASLLEVGESAGHVGDLGDRQVLGGAGGGLGRHRGDHGSAVARDDQAVGAGQVGRAGHGAEVVRILDAVEGDQERRTGSRGDQLVDVGVVVFAGDGDQPLVAGAGQRVELAVGPGLDGDSALAGRGGDVAASALVADVEHRDALGSRVDQLAHRSGAVDQPTHLRRRPARRRSTGPRRPGRRRRGSDGRRRSNRRRRRGHRAGSSPASDRRRRRQPDERPG